MRRFRRSLSYKRNPDQKIQANRCIGERPWFEILGMSPEPRGRRCQRED
jgi:hypothetical protein